MNFDQTSIFVILGLALIGFIWGRFRYDVVAFVALIAAVIIGVIPADRAFLGFGHPATITVIGVLIMSKALQNSGFVEIIADRLAPLTGSPSTHIGTLVGIGAPLSAIMNNVGALSLLMPVAVQSAIKAKRSPAVVLMPLSFGTILGGLVTLIGTPPNIIIATYRGTVTGEPFGMFDFSPAGLAIAVAGSLFIALIGWRLIPKSRRSAPPPGELFHIEDYVAEAIVPEGSEAIGRSLGEIDDESRDQDVVLIGLIRGQMRIYAAARHQFIQADDILVLEGPAEKINKFVSSLTMEMVGLEGEGTAFLKADHMSVNEVVVSPGSRMEGRSARDLRLAGRYGVNMLALSRQGQPLMRRLNSVQFRAGDVLLFQGETERLAQVMAQLGCLPLAARPLQIGRARKAGLTAAIFAAAIAAAALGFLPLPISISAAAAAVVLLNILPVTQLYESIDWPVVVLLGAMMPIGEALESTGATRIMAEVIGDASTGLSPLLILAALMIITMTLSDIMNNAATAVVAAPIAFGVAQILGVNPDAFLMAVAVGASCAFLTPIGHQNNAIILGPGGYHFSDYWRMGLPLEVIIVFVGVPVIAWVFPL
jgi:di/tricarboxylate transporter